MKVPLHVTGEQVAAARLQVVLDQKLGRQTPEVVRSIAELREPLAPDPPSESKAVDQPRRWLAGIDSSPQTALLILTVALTSNLLAWILITRGFHAWLWPAVVLTTVATLSFLMAFKFVFGDQRSLAGFVVFYMGGSLAFGAAWMLASLA